MIRIFRDPEGNHFTGGKPFYPTGVREYRKIALSRAVRMSEPFSVETLEGTMEGKAGDWLMIGIDGEMYPCDASIFAKTYEKA